MLELKEYTDNVLSLFDIKSVSEMGKALTDTIFGGNLESVLDRYSKIIGDSDKDWIKHLYQYYQADRVKNKQDYTPQCIADLCAALTDCKSGTVYDCCAGSGALTLAAHKRNKELDFVCVELDENVIPFLLFNLCLHNINATVINGDVLSGKQTAVYNVVSGDKYSTVSKSTVPFEFPQMSAAISNPPYNIKWNPPTEAEAVLDKRFSECDIPPSGNANFAFVLDCFSRLKEGKAALVLPQGVLSTDNKKEAAIRKYLVDGGYIDSVVTLPDKMFDITSIGTCILTLTKTPSDSISLVDCRDRHDAELRKQNGQYGSKSHTNRTYTKLTNTISDEQITDILSAIAQKKDIAGFCITVDKKAVSGRNAALIPGWYIRPDFQRKYHRPYRDIVKNINDITRLRNACKLTINETVARKLLGDGNVDNYKHRPEDEEGKFRRNTEKITGCVLAEDDFITFTKGKNEIKIECRDKEYVPPVFSDFLRTWIVNNGNLGLLVNTYLQELRDALLPELMSGEIDVSEVEL